MKLWALIVAGIYVATLATLSVPLFMLALEPHYNLTDAVHFFNIPPFWVWLAIMAIGQFALLAVPIRVANSRPVKRAPVWLTLGAGGLMAGALVVGAFFSIFEFATFSRGNFSADW